MASNQLTWPFGLEQMRQPDLNLLNSLLSCLSASLTQKIRRKKTHVDPIHRQTSSAGPPATYSTARASEPLLSCAEMGTILKTALLVCQRN